MVDPALYWLTIGVMLFVLGLVLPGFVLFFFAVSALATALLAWLLPTTAIVLQLGFFIVASLVTLFCLRGFIEKRFIPSGPANDGEEVDVQRALPSDKAALSSLSVQTKLMPLRHKGVVCSTIVPPAEGRIKCFGSSWRATADEQVEEGEIVMVVRQNGLVIHVERV